MDYEEKYKEALERARQFFEKPYLEDSAGIVGYIFPELAESDDEKTRKQIIEHIMWSEDNGNCATEEKERWIAWLEKQCEQKHVNIVEPRFKINDKVIHKETGKIWTIHWYLADTNSYYVIDEEELIHHYSEDVLEYAEQKPAEEIEPTPIFRIGDVLKRKGKDYTFIVDRIQGGYYHCDHNNGAFFPIEEQGNWELVEQKPTDEEMKELLRTEYEKERADAIAEMQKPAEDSCKNSDDIITEEKDRTEYKKGFECGKQRVLKYPEDFGLCKKPAWSEEDERNLDWLMTVCERIHYKSDPQVAPDSALMLKDWLKSLKDRVRPQPKQEWSEKDELMLGKCIDAASGYYSPEDKQSMKDWLYSLKERYTWKPREEQMIELRRVISGCSYDIEPLVEMEEQLKKLRKK